MRYLFERLVEPMAPPSMDMLKEDIRAQVQRLVDSQGVARHRGSLDLLNLSLPSVTQMGTDASAEHKAYAERIRRILLRFEPRLRNPEVSVAVSGGSSGNARLLIRASLSVADQVEPFEFSTGAGGN